MRRQHQREDLAKAGLEIVEIIGLGALVRKLQEAKFPFPDGGRCVMGEPTWYVTPKDINTANSKKSLFMFAPRQHPEPFGDNLTAVLDLAMDGIRGTASYQSCAKQGEVNEAVGVHYYVPGDYLGGHRDVTLMSCLWSTGPTVFHVPHGGELAPCRVSRDEQDAPDILLGEDELVCMFGLGAQLLGYGAAVYHEVPAVQREKFTFGVFLEMKDRETMLTLPDGRQVRHGDFAKEYFAPDSTDPLIHALKNALNGPALAEMS